MDGMGILCNHYLAVYYCWQSDAGKSAPARKGSYRVLVEGEDGLTFERANKTPDETINRAVEFMSHVEARLV